MDVTLNGDARRVGPGATLGALVDEAAGDRRGVAVAVNEEVVPRSRWDATALRPGDRVEILTAAQGG